MQQRSLSLAKARPQTVPDASRRATQTVPEEIRERSERSVTKGDPKRSLRSVVSEANEASRRAAEPIAHEATRTPPAANQSRRIHNRSPLLTQVPHVPIADGGT